MTQVVRPVSAASAVQQLQLAVLQNARKRGWSFSARQTDTAHLQNRFCLQHAKYRPYQKHAVRS